MRQIVPVGPGNWTKKVFPFFRVIYNTRRDVFGIVRHFFSKKSSPKGRPSFFWSFATECSWKIPNGPPFSFFRHCETFFKFFSQQRVLSSIFFDNLRQNGWKISKRPLVRQFGPTFGFFEYCTRKCFDTLESFCYFWALHMAPTWAVPGLFQLWVFALYFEIIFDIFWWEKISKTDEHTNKSYNLTISPNI